MTGSSTHTDERHAPIDCVETLIDVAKKMGMELNVDSGTHLPDGTVEYDAYIMYSPEERMNDNDTERRH